MKLLILGHGKTGSLVAEVAAERKHHVRVVGRKKISPARPNDGKAAGHRHGHRLHRPARRSSPTSKPASTLARTWSSGPPAGTTTRPDSHPGRAHKTGFVYAANFSVGVNLFFEIARAAAAALRHDYSGQIFERHHAHKKDAPSGTAIALQQVIRESSGRKENIEITSFREGDVVGLHESFSIPRRPHLSLPRRQVPPRFRRRRRPRRRMARRQKGLLRL